MFYKSRVALAISSALVLYPLSFHSVWQRQIDSYDSKGIVQRERSNNTWSTEVWNRTSTNH